MYCFYITDLLINLRIHDTQSRYLTVIGEMRSCLPCSPLEPSGNFVAAASNNAIPMKVEYSSRL